jgi:hypothetical protein
VGVGGLPGCVGVPAAVGAVAQEQSERGERGAVLIGPGGAAGDGDRPVELVQLAGGLEAGAEDQRVVGEQVGRGGLG